MAEATLADLLGLRRQAGTALSATQHGHLTCLHIRQGAHERAVWLTAERAWELSRDLRRALRRDVPASCL
jgi:hypothetical protein